MQVIRFSWRRGFSLVELLGVLIAIAFVSSIGVISITHIKQTADASKLEQDVAALNRAVEIYRSGGGDLSGLTGSSVATIDAILTKLKSHGESHRLIGVTSAVLDVRVTPNYGDNSMRRRARWNSGKVQFVVADSATEGVVEFMLDDSLASEASATESGRAAPKVLAADGGWVWDTGGFVEQAPAEGLTPGSVFVVSNPRILDPLSHGFSGGAFITASGMVSTKNKVYDGAGYQGELGVFSLDGMGNPPYDLATSDGLLAFMREAVRRVVEGGAQGGIALSKNGTGHDVAFAPGSVVAFILIPNNSFVGAASYLAQDNPSARNTAYPLTSLSFATGDAGGFSQSQAVGLGNNVFAIEDMSGGGDRDYEDVVWQTEGVEEPGWSTMRDVDARTYYSKAKLDQLGDPILGKPREKLRDALTRVGVFGP